MRYVALLRGINVGGNTMIKMEDLRETFEALGFKNVTSYINSGNLAFDVGSAHESKGSSQNESNLIAKIESAIERDSGKAIPVMVRERSDIGRILQNNPFDGQFESHKEMHVLFMKDEMPKDKQTQLLEHQTESERFVVDGREIYCHLKLGVADSLLGKGFIDKKLKVSITGRNWRTVEKLAVL
jgi:uncharacterized protein (DUF1697 family)